MYLVRPLISIFFVNRFSRKLKKFKRKYCTTLLFDENTVLTMFLLFDFSNVVCRLCCKYTPHSHTSVQSQMRKNHNFLLFQLFLQQLHLRTRESEECIRKRSNDTDFRIFSQWNIEIYVNKKLLTNQYLTTKYYDFSLLFFF